METEITTEEKESHSCLQCMYGEKNTDEMPCCECVGYSMFVNCRPYDEDVAVKYDGWFEEVCGVCRRVRIVHDDPETNLDNPGFICLKCQEDREREPLQEMSNEEYANARQFLHSDDEQGC